MIGAFDFGGTKTAVGLISLNGTIYKHKTISTDTNNCTNHLSLSSSILIELLREEGLSIDNLIGVGVSVPGIINNDKQTLIKSAYKNWNDKNIGKLLKDILKINNIVIENDVNACALAEIKFGHSTYKNFIWTTISTGIGGAIVCNGELFRGWNNYSGELGHVKVEYDKPYRCPTCNQLGCLEAHGSGTALSKIFANTIARHHQLAEEVEDRNLKIDGVSCSILAKEGNKYALECFKEIGIYIGRGLSYTINLLNPQAIILGGGVVDSLDLIQAYIKKEFVNNVHPDLLPITLVKSRLGYSASLIGAATLVMN